MNLNQVTLPSTDILRSIEFYCGMGFILIVDSPEYARFECPDGHSTFSVHLVSEMMNNSNVVVYFESSRLDELVLELQNKRYKFDQTPKDEEWLWREARLRDPDNNTLCFYYAGENRRFPPWRVE
ncbi:VOC family protein [Pseudohongiella acticola]|jgi:catechol 2,3-dioxygenase-like lactoylglutathione lyase family enzyme|uniref:VOC family protein n=1 Tax=Pseudohongiella acticola TaxID=1524254 RepID=UPI0030ED65FC